MTQINQTLKDYYKSHPSKAQFARRVAERCGVCTNAVYKWCLGDGATKNKVYLQVLSEETKIEQEYLFSPKL